MRSMENSQESGSSLHSSKLTTDDDVRLNVGWGKPNSLPGYFAPSRWMRGRSHNGILSFLPFCLCLSAGRKALMFNWANHLSTGPQRGYRPLCRWQCSWNRRRIEDKDEEFPSMIPTPIVYRHLLTRHLVAQSLLTKDVGSTSSYHFLSRSQSLLMRISTNLHSVIRYRAQAHVPYVRRISQTSIVSFVALSLEQ